MEAKEKREIFLGYAKEIKALGYRVFVTESKDPRYPALYGWVVNEKDEIGYFQYDVYEGVHFSTVHKAMHEYGTGFAAELGDTHYTTFSRELVDKCFVRVPDWMLARPSWEKKYLGEIKKLTATEYFENYWNKENVKEI